MIEVLFFGKLRETMGAASWQLDLGTIGSEPTAEQVLAAAFDYFGGEEASTADSRQGLRCAINQSMSDFSARVEDNDEVAFFPPVTGG
ncbi:MoaD/ThiS family protein [Allohahella marinimesophila]|uniref:Molybdopterin synthase sulfur carrier subunit n=1 Tax=Allohahella marinimesophila TaxID=1054972 RepID=A0ABP7NF45_9GAMM